jgi:hypothetical protein
MTVDLFLFIKKKIERREMEKKEYIESMEKKKEKKKK